MDGWPWLETFFMFIFGAVTGSFLNVCVHRLPREESVIRPRSHCPACKKTIAWYDNIPIFSFLILGGKCRACGARIRFRYYVVELVSGLLWVFLWRRYGLSPLFFYALILLSILLAVSLTDLETGYIPDALTFFGMGSGLLLSTVFPRLIEENLWYRGLWQSFLGLLAGGGSLLALGLLGNLIFRKESMGGGDIKLLAMIGTFMGTKKVLFVLMYAPIISLPFVLFKLFKKEKTIPFGPFLALSGAWFFIYGERFLSEFYFF